MIQPAIGRLRFGPGGTRKMHASFDLGGVRASTAAATRSAFQVQGSSRASSWVLVRPETTRSSTSVSRARGSTPFSFAVATRLATIAQWRALRYGRGGKGLSEPARRASLRPSATPRITRSYEPRHPVLRRLPRHREHVPSGRLVRLRMLDRGVRLTPSGLSDDALPLQRHQGGVHRLLALVVVLLQEGVQVGGVGTTLALADDVEDLLTERVALRARRAGALRGVGVTGPPRRSWSRCPGSGKRLAGLD